VAIESPTHPTQVTIANSGKAKVVLSSRNVAMDKDFILKVKTAEPCIPRSWVEVDGQNKAVMVAFYPKFEVENISTEM
jgi:hypothetical protein